MSQWDFSPTFDNPNQTEWAPKPAPAAAPAAPAAPADVPPSLEGGPSYLAFQKALGLQRSNAERTSQQTIDSINQQKPITEQWLGRNNDLANRQISGAMESRGLYRSGETGTHLADQAAAYGHSLSALDADTQNRIAAIQQALATQETGFDAQDIVAKQDSADRQQLAKAQGDIQQQLLDALAKGQTLPDLSTILPGGVALPKGDGGTAANGIVKAAMSWQGTPYQWGGGHGGTLHAGQAVDCSGLVQQVFAENGIRISGTAADMQKMGQAVPTLAQAQPGDLVFYGSPAHHVGIYIGNGQMIDAPHTGAAVRIENVGSFGADFSGIRRVASGLGQLTSPGQVI